MKRFTKTLLSVAAVSAVSAAMAVSAMAADMSASYAGDTVTLANVKSTGAQQTLLILDGAETVVENADGSNNIVQIDQKDDGTVFATTKVGTLKDGTYYVRIGGTDGTLQKYTLTVSSEPTTKTKTIVIGDVSNDGFVDGTDVVYAARFEVYGEPYDDPNEGTGDAGVEATKVDGSTIILGDVSGDGYVDGTDVVYMARLEVYGEPYDDPNEGTGNAGYEVDIVVK